jgi:hypothetical protein
MTCHPSAAPRAALTTIAGSRCSRLQRVVRTTTSEFQRHRQHHNPRRPPRARPPNPAARTPSPSLRTTPSRSATRSKASSRRTPASRSPMSPPATRGPWRTNSSSPRTPPSATSSSASTTPSPAASPARCPRARMPRPGLPTSADLSADDGHLLTPIDYGDVCVNADKGWYRREEPPHPDQTLDDLAGAAYKDQLVVENPASSSPGLAFLAATVGAKGEDGYLDYWGKLTDNGVKVAKGWTEAYTGDFSGSAGKGPRPLVVSYATSPAFEVDKGATESRTVASARHLLPAGRIRRRPQGQPERMGRTEVHRLHAEQGGAGRNPGADVHVPRRHLGRPSPPTGSSSPRWRPSRSPSTPRPSARSARPGSRTGPPGSWARPSA